jgi:ABC-2 type transport system ATP-binding protein
MIVEFEAVEKRYGKVQALRDANLSVPEGATLGLIGPNGAGKTTSMLIATSLLQRDGGMVRIGGIDPERDPKAVRRHVGYMPDFFGVYEGLRSRTSARRPGRLSSPTCSPSSTSRRRRMPTSTRSRGA